jgi:hypothetical protein
MFWKFFMLQIYKLFVPGIVFLTGREQEQQKTVHFPCYIIYFGTETSCIESDSQTVFHVTLELH